jgi:hypothetical protein
VRCLENSPLLVDFIYIVIYIGLPRESFHTMGRVQALDGLTHLRNDNGAGEAEAFTRVSASTVARWEV